MKKLIIIIFLVLFSLAGFSQELTHRLSIGLATPLMITEPEFENVVGDYIDEEWNFGISCGYSLFKSIEDSKIEWGFDLKYSHWNLKSMEIDITEEAEFNYYGIGIVAGDIMNTGAKLSGDIGEGKCNIVQISPSIRWGIVTDDNWGVALQPGVGMYIFDRKVEDVIPQGDLSVTLEDKNTNITYYYTKENQETFSTYHETGLHLGVNLGLSANFKFIEIQPYYQVLLTHDFTHFGSINLIFAF